MGGPDSSCNWHWTVVRKREHRINHLHLLFLTMIQIGYSALVGLGVLVLAFPLQIGLVKIMFSQRKKAVGVTDLRIRLTTEVLQGIRLIKLYAWEAFYTRQLSDLRRKEIRAIRKQA